MLLQMFKKILDLDSEGRDTSSAPALEPLPPNYNTHSEVIPTSSGDDYNR
jgi:hypothetical protein